MAAQRRRPHRGLPFVLSAISAAMLLAGCASTHGLTPGGRVIEADSLSNSRSLGTPALSDAAFPAQGSEEHTSELQSLMRISYAVFCLKKKKHTILTHTIQ